MGWFDEDDDDESHHNQAQQSSSKDDDEDDPLEVYMKGLADEQTASSSPRQRRRLDLDNEDEATDHWVAHQETKTPVEEPMESKPNALDDHFHQAGDQRSVDHFAPVIASTSTTPFHKRFWTPTNTEEGRQWRKQHQIHCSVPIDPVYHFAELRDVLGEPLLHQITDDYRTPTLVQSQTLAVALAGLDALITAATGQGKTLAYLWPLAVHIADQPHLADDETGPIGIVLVPTRELAQQVYKIAAPVLAAAAEGATAKVVIGGQGRYLLWQELQRAGGIELVVATPGRLLDVLSDKKGLSLSRTTFCVLDEADKMLQMGFESQVSQILSGIRKDRQTLMLSATMGRRVEASAKKWLLSDHVRIAVGRTGEASENVEQHVMVLPSVQAKKDFLLEMLPVFQSVGRTLVFVATRDGCEAMAKDVKERLPSVVVETLHGDKHQSDRNAALRAFTKGQINILICTDVASRGLDVPQVATVVNFDPAKNLDSHVHRIGRAGRLSKDKEQQTGTAYTLLTPHNADFARILLSAFEREGREIPVPLRELALKSRRSGHVAAARSKVNRAGLGFDSRDVSHVTHDYAPPAKKSRWGPKL